MYEFSLGGWPMARINDFFSAVFSFINDYLLIISLLCVGGFYLFILRGIQLKYLKHAFTLLWDKRTSYDDDKVNISPLQSFLTGLAARIGMGNIAGVATAIAQGGPGAVFWMWVAAFLGMGTSFVENSLGQLYKTRTKQGSFVGGPAYYIRFGLGSKKLALLFSLILAFTYGFAFISLQTSQISDSLNHAYDMPKATIAGLLIFLTGIIIFSSLKTITTVSSILIPIMSLVYIALAIILICFKWYEIPKAYMIIIHSAFNMDAAIGGTIGAAVNYGVKRGLFSNEAGMGSSPNIAAAANVKHPVSQGLVQMVGTFLDTIVICSLTAFVVILSGAYDGSPLQGASLAQEAVASFIGDMGRQLLVILIFLFAFTSVIGYYVYGSVGITYITERKDMANYFRIGVLCFCGWGAYAAPTLVWDVADYFMLVMTVLNVIAILYLWKDVYLLLNDYRMQRKFGFEVPIFNVAKYPDLSKKIPDPTVWSVQHHYAKKSDSKPLMPQRD